MVQESISYIYTAVLSSDLRYQKKDFPTLKEYGKTIAGL